MSDTRRVIKREPDEQASIKQEDDDRASFEEAIAMMQAHIVNLERSHNTQTEQLRVKDNILAFKDRLIIAKDQEIGAKNRLIIIKDEELAQRGYQIIKLESLMDHQVHDLQFSLDFKHDIIDHLMQKVQTAETRVHQLSGEQGNGVLSTLEDTIMETTALRKRENTLKDKVAVLAHVVTERNAQIERLQRELDAVKSIAAAKATVVVGSAMGTKKRKLGVSESVENGTASLSGAAEVETSRHDKARRLSKRLAARTADDSK